MDTSPVALITGASRGIGASSAVELGRRGYRIVVNYRSRPERAAEVVDDVVGSGGQAVAVAADVTDPRQAGDLVDAALERFGRLDALVCNAATPVRFTAFDDLAWDEFATKVTVELAAAFHVTRAAVPVMSRQRHGRLVYVSSDMAVHSAVPAGIAHGTGKAALEAFARYLAVQYGPAGITANVVRPGYVRTDASDAGAPADRVAEIAERTPVGRLADPADVGRVVAALVADVGDFVSAVTVPVTGGLHATR